METEYEKRAQLFKALSDSRRQKILDLLHEGEKCVCILCEEMNMPQSTISYHMKALCEAGIVSGREEGKWTYYRINEAGVQKIFDVLTEVTSVISTDTVRRRCGDCCVEEETNKTVTVEYLYLDLETCDRCVGTDKILEHVLKDLAPVFKQAGYSVTYKKIEIRTAEMAKEFHFLSSPTIRVNGKDICETVLENDCVCCGEIAGTQVNCRVFEYEGTLYEVPPKEMLVECIMKNAFHPVESYCEAEAYVLPENLKIFFEGKEEKAKSNSSGCT